MSARHSHTDRVGPSVFLCTKLSSALEQASPQSNTINPGRLGIFKPFCFNVIGLD